MKLTIANVFATCVACAALAAAARASEPVPQVSQAQLALATSDVTSQNLTPVRLSASNLTYDAGIDPENLRIELERAPRGIEFEICHNEEVFSFVDATTYTFFSCQP